MYLKEHFFTDTLSDFLINALSGCISSSELDCPLSLAQCLHKVTWIVNSTLAGSPDVTAIIYSDIASVTPSELYYTPVLLWCVLGEGREQNESVECVLWTWQWLKSLVFRVVIIFYCSNPTQSLGRCISYIAHPAIPIKAYLEPFSTRNNKSLQIVYWIE